MSIKIGKLTIKPEIEKPMYWVHLLIDVLIIYTLINWFAQPMQITIQNVSLGTLFLGIADIISHTILKLD